MRMFGVLVLLFSFIAGACRVSFAQEWRRIGDLSAAVRALVYLPGHGAGILAGTDRGVYSNSVAGGSWRWVLPRRDVVSLAYGDSGDRSVYAATAGGLFYSGDGGATWSCALRRFRGGYVKVTDVVCSGGKIFAATGSGILVSHDRAKSWAILEGVSGCAPRGSFLAASSSTVYAAGPDGVFRIETGSLACRRILFSGQDEAEGQTSVGAEDHLDENSGAGWIRGVCLHPATGALIVFGDKGIYTTEDGGASWKTMTSAGLPAGGVRAMLIDQEAVIYAAADSGVFVLSGGSWERAGSVIDPAFCLLLYGNVLYAGTGFGVYRLEDRGVRTSGNGMASGTRNDGFPSVREVQQAAIRYADADLGRIYRWRKKAAAKAWLPEVSCGLNRDAGDLWHWEGGSTSKDNDDILRKGRDCVEWDVTCKWDLGELVWSSAQTDIDVRSRLLVQLRQQVVDDVTRLYFEYSRLLMEYSRLSAGDSNKRQDILLKIDEMAAGIDGLTDGYFTARLPAFDR